MIINFSVENFGSIKEKQTLSFLANKSDHLEDYYIIEPIKGLRLNKLALIYGANASGKTTVLKALDFLREICTNPFDKKTDKFNFEPFLFDENTPRQNTKFELEFVHNGIKYFYEVELNKNCIVKERLYNFSPNKALVFERSTDITKELTSIKFGNKIKKRKVAEDSLEIFTLWNNTVFGGFQKTNLDSFELMESSEWFKNLLNLAIDNKKSEEFVTKLLEAENISKSFVLDILQKADLNISDLDLNIQNADLDDDTINYFSKYGEKVVEELRDKATIREVILIHNVNGKKYSLNIDSESKGTQRYLGYSGLLNMLIKYDGFIMPIDELESSLHPDLFQHFLFLFIVNSKKSQLIVTTHNREILNNRDMFRDDGIWFTDKNEDSATELYSLADFDSSVVRTDTGNVLNAYKSGKLGGVPNLGDYYIDLDNE
ncbi:ATP-binding protein [Chryseobacterium sp.]|uniref:AAA family ATPase n=1 Tax=Chryseobacterium sp. TaxID=1871047 RepID=UPI002898DBD1|nr:ATP-binding protein [Chryseobacterium sp.]